MKIKKEIESEWKQYRFAIAGAACIFLAWIFWLGQKESCRYITWALLAASLGFEWYLLKNNITLISDWIQRQFRPLVDFIILLIFTLISVYWIHTHWQGQVHNHTIYQAMVLWTLMGHFFGSGD